MNTWVPMDAFNWVRPPAESLDANLYLPKKIEWNAYTVGPNVWNKFKNKETGKTEDSILDFYYTFGPLTQEQRINRKMTVEEFRTLQKKLDSKSGDIEKIVLLGLPHTDLFFRPHTLFDYIRLLDNRTLANSDTPRLCALPGCKKAALPTGKYCEDKHKSKHYRERNREAQQRWPDCKTWKEAKEKGYLTANADDFDIIE